MKLFSSISRFLVPRARRRLSSDSESSLQALPFPVRAQRRLPFAAFCALCVCAAAVLAIFGYRHFRESSQEVEDRLIYPIFEPIMNAREVTIDVVRVDGAREPKGAIEAAAKTFDKYIPGRVRIVGESTVTLNQPPNRHHLESIIQKNKSRGLSVITLVIAPYSPVVDISAMATSFKPWRFCNNSGHVIVIEADDVDRFESYLKTSHGLGWQHVIIHELCHVFNLPAAPRRRISGSHCKNPECALFVGTKQRKPEPGWAPTLDLCSGCAEEIARLQRQNNKPLQDYGQEYDIGLWYKRQVQLNPRNPVALGQLANHLVQKEEYAQALEEFAKAIRMDPRNARFYAARAEPYVKMGETQKAIDDYTKALHLDKRSASTWASRGLIFAAINHNKQALSDLSRALQLEPKDSDFALARALVNHDMGDHVRALSDIERSIHFSWYNARAIGFRGALYLDALHDPEKALDDLNRAIRCHPERAKFRVDRSRTYSTMKEYTKASADLEKALQMEPENLDTVHVLLEFLIECPDPAFRNLDRAVQLAAKHFDRIPWTNPRIAEALAKACADKKEYLAAMRHQEKAVSLAQDKARKAELEETLYRYRSFLVR